MKPSIKEFLVMVGEELHRIKQNATASEIAKLYYEHFDNSSSTRCIYGQMTGNYRSNRASEISPKKYGSFDSDYFKNDDFERDNTTTDLERYAKFNDNFDGRVKMRNIFRFLKGEADSVVLSVDENSSRETLTIYASDSNSNFGTIIKKPKLVNI